MLQVWEKEKGMHGLIGKPEKRTSLRRLSVDGRIMKGILE